ncbi:MAG: helix-turn-helix transcriptional regulator [Bacteroidota bacterium]
METITRTEEMLLLAACRLGDDAYGADIRAEIEAVTGRRYSVGGVYVPLDRLVRKGLLETEEGAPTAKRRGRPRRRYRVTSAGFAALRAARDLHEAMWARLPEFAWKRLGLSLSGLGLSR